jgi:hypothetical protein
MQQIQALDNEAPAAAHVPHDNVYIHATLSTCPRDLHSLWEEYEHGLDGCKAAKNFNPTERGRVASTYSKRNLMWHLISRLINSRGIHYSAANDCIYEVYGNISVTTIVKAIQKGCKEWWPPKSSINR